MKKILSGNVVTLVTIPKYLPVIVRPGIGDYNNPYIRKITPCEVINGEYRDIRTGAKVEKADNMLEWINLSGTVFCYKDQHNSPKECLLISRRYADGKLLLLSIAPWQITPCMIPRKVRDRQVDDY